ncbi:MAG: formimidoylglutamate deiminase [Rhodospirillales bacterium 20-60-12]|nr:MAG: formimidoylglutamate deiminase [Rhodospirillales bacterium 20-60-12]HQT67397.1 formimidoylglutamate deiminase [Acetobacteraceae bacterium]HQU00886.1 formimidoylglutamate deiminase [Acetobacteraceae bacterium]
MKKLWASSALLPAGWAANVGIDIAEDGNIAAVHEGIEAAQRERLPGPLLAGVANLHSHAFQRGMAGLAETLLRGADNFWTWREAMYRCAMRVSPEQLQAIAAYLFIEMLKSGYTNVTEFHYLHHAPDGTAYTNPAELSLRTIEAARQAGIGLTMLPSLYCQGGFAGETLRGGQQRFATDVGMIQEIIRRLREHVGRDPQCSVGLAPHSLRAVPVGLINEALTALGPDDPVHIHIAEQTREVEDCMAATGRSPVAHLLCHVPVDQRWCLIHGTHMTADEIRDVAATQAVIGFCPITEANLGDGIFDLPALIEANGRFGIGTDSNVMINPFEELRWLEYVQRLRHRQRGMAVPPGQSGSIGGALYRAVTSSAALVAGRRIGQIAAGYRADFCVLDEDLLSLPDLAGDAWLDSAMFAARTNPVRDVMVGGVWLVHAGHHAGEEAAKMKFDRAMREIADV